MMSFRRSVQHVTTGSVVLLLVIAGGFYAWNQQANKSALAALERGRQFLRERRDELAEKELDHYLNKFPDDAEAILLRAQAVVTGKSRPVKEAGLLAIEQLEAIPDSSPLAAETRMRQGRIALLILHQPERAERLLRKSLQLDPALSESSFLMWKLLELTERHAASEPFFWMSWDSTPDEMRTQRLKEWYVSQFSSASANAELDFRMGFLPRSEQTSDAVIFRRLEEFTSQEPDGIVARTAKAAFLIHLREREDAMQLLNEISNSPVCVENAFFLSTYVNLLLELGRLDEAKQWFTQWAAPRDTFDYFRTEGRIQQIIERNDTAAIESFDKALALWPGAVDWSVLHFKASSLARIGRKQEADQARTDAQHFEKLMELDVHRKLRTALSSLSSPEDFETMEQFYRSIRRNREADEWLAARRRQFGQSPP